jgi:TonB family protein
MTPVEHARYRRFVCVLVSILVHVSAGAFFYSAGGLDRARTSPREGPNAPRVERFAITIDRRARPIVPEPVEVAEFTQPRPEPRVQTDPPTSRERRPEMPEPVKPTASEIPPPTIRDLPAPSPPIDWRPELAAARAEATRRLSELSRRLTKALGDTRSRARRLASARHGQPDAARPVSPPAETPDSREPRRSARASKASSGATGPARPRAAIQPEYPPASIRRGQTGTVIVEADVSAAGEVTDAEVVASSGHARLDRAALAAVREAAFAPATRGGEPVADTVRVPIHFRLRR